MTPKERSTAQLFIKTFKQSLNELMDYHLTEPITIVETRGLGEVHDVSAIVGFCEARFRASIALTTSCRTIAEQFDIPATDAPDWLGEMCNQLVGRFKNKLSIFGLQPQLSTPTTVCGNVLKVGSVAGDACAYRIRWVGGELITQMSLELDEEICLLENCELAPMAEGSLHFF